MPEVFPRSSACRAALMLLAPLALAPQAQAAPVELFDAPEFRGMALGVDRPLENLADYGFDRRTASIVIHDGRWEFCTEPDYRGTCVTLGPGRHADLPRGLQQNVRSLRTRNGDMPTAGSMAPDARAGDAAAVLYDQGDFEGRALPLHGAVASLGKLGMGDRVSSLEVRRGHWQVCTDSNYHGHCETFGPGRHRLTGRMHDEASSVRPLFGPDRRPLPEAGGLTLFENSDFSGRSLLVTAATEYLGRVGFGDMASAVEVHGGLWDICTDSGYQGRCITLGPGRHVLTGRTHDRASSVRPRRADDSPAWRGGDPERSMY